MWLLSLYALPSCITGNTAKVERLAQPFVASTSEDAPATTGDPQVPSSSWADQVAQVGDKKLDKEDGEIWRMRENQKVP